VTAANVSNNATNENNIQYYLGWRECDKVESAMLTVFGVFRSLIYATLIVFLLVKVYESVYKLLAGEVATSQDKEPY
jgi:hypothetical protein